MQETVVSILAHDYPFYEYFHAYTPEEINNRYLFTRRQWSFRPTGRGGCCI